MIISIVPITGVTPLHTACEKVDWVPSSNPAPALGPQIRPHHQWEPKWGLREAATTLITIWVGVATTATSLTRVPGCPPTSSNSSSRGAVRGEANSTASHNRMRGLPGGPNRARYGEPHTPTMIAMVEQISLPLRATLTFTTITATTPTSLTSLFTPTSLRMVVREVVRPPLRRATPLPHFTSPLSHPPALPPPLLPLLGKMEVAKSPCITTQLRGRLKLALGTVLVKEPAVVMLAVAAM